MVAFWPPKIEQESCYEEHQWLSPLPESYNLKKQVLEEHKKIKVKEKSRGSANTQSLKADKTQLKTGSTEKTQVKFMPSINGKPWKTYLKLCDTETTPRQKKISINAIKFMIQPARGYVWLQPWKRITCSRKNCKSTKSYRCRRNFT